MKRREALKHTGLLTAAGLSIGSISAILSGCESTTSTPNVGILEGKHIDALTAMTDVIIPTTDTPGANDAGVPEELIFHVNNNFLKEDQEEFLTGLNHIEEVSNKEFGNDFHKLKIEDQESVMTLLAAEEGSDTIFKTLKNLTVYLFFTSELGAKKVLNYLPIPGEYLPCVDYADIGSTWAL